MNNGVRETATEYAAATDHHIPVAARTGETMPSAAPVEGFITQRSADGTWIRSRVHPFEVLPKPVGLAGDAATRKAAPMASGVLFYFPNALAAVAALSKIGNDQHNPGQPMHWAFDKSTDEADCILRHLAQAGTVDTDGVRHSAKVAWRALALLERELLTAHAELQPGRSVKGFKR